MEAPTNAARGAITVHTATIEDNETTPIAGAGEDREADEGVHVDLDGSGSSDPDGHIVSHEWIQTGGALVPLNGADTETPWFTAPDVDADRILVFRFLVTDDDGLDARDAVVITVRHIPPPAPSGIAPNLSLTKGFTISGVITVDFTLSSDGAVITGRLAVRARSAGDLFGIYPQRAQFAIFSPTPKRQEPGGKIQAALRQTPVATRPAPRARHQAPRSRVQPSCF